MKEHPHVCVQQVAFYESIQMSAITHSIIEFGLFASLLTLNKLIKVIVTFIPICGCKAINWGCINTEESKVTQLHSYAVTQLHKV